MKLEDLRKVESQCLEFKRSLSLRREGLEALNAMINAEPAKGVVVFGVAPDRQVVGVEPGNLDQAQRSLVQHIQSSFDPPIQVVVQLLEADDKTLFVVSATRHKGVPYHEYDGRAFIREGSVCRQLTVQEKQQLLRARKRDLHNGPWRCDRCGSYVGMLASIVLTDQGAYRTYQCTCEGEFWPAT